MQAAANPAEPLPMFKVKYPNGAEQEFPQEWQAAQAVAISGGELVRPGQEDAAQDTGQAATPTG